MKLNKAQEKHMSAVPKFAANDTSSPDPADIAKSFAEAAERSARLLSEYMARQAITAPTMPTDELGIARAFMEMTSKMLMNPVSLAQAQMRMMWDYMSLWQASVLKMLGHSGTAVIEPAAGDKRFRHEDWQNNFLFDYIKQSYLITARHVHETVAGVDGLDAETARKVNFYTRQYIDALSPSNFAMTNPEVLTETVKSGGQNLVKGLNNLLKDIESGDGKLKISMTDTTAFRLGENVATTPGKVIYQNELMQLIQYAPSTKQVAKRPLLIVPPWINKFYILDLREKNSLIKWCVDQGHTTFVISWVNPDERHASKNFEDYMFEGILSAVDAIEKATGEPTVNAMGYCLGGTLLGATLAYLAAKGKSEKIASATFLTTMLDFLEPGEMEIFIDEQQIQSLERKMNERGYLEGSEMANTFNMMRANDLIWSFVVSNYLMGKDPFPFDLLYWNSDSTRMPAKMHSFYLRNMYMRNLLKKPGGIALGGVPIDLGKVKVPAYFLSTVEDHIAPWKSTYRGTPLLSGKTRFVLGGSGHIAGVVNPPASNKYFYYTNDKLAETGDAWLKGATQHAGSWWTDWNAWIGKQNGGTKVTARIPGKGKLKIVEDAPGSYVKARLA